jgi:hypothetical protein
MPFLRPDRILRDDLPSEELTTLLMIRRLRIPALITLIGFLILLLSPLFMGGY